MFPTVAATLGEVCSCRRELCWRQLGLKPRKLYLLHVLCSVRILFEQISYTMVMAMVFGGMNPMKTTSSPLPDIKTHPTTQQPNSASQAKYFTLLCEKNITLKVHFYWSNALLETNDKNQKPKPSFSVIKQQALWFKWSSRFIQTGQSESNYTMFGCQHFSLLKQKDSPSAIWLNSTC